MDLNPAGQTPVLVESQKGTVLIDSGAICEYFEETIDRTPMIPGTAVNRAEIRRLVTWFDEKLYRDVVGAADGRADDQAAGQPRPARHRRAQAGDDRGQRPSRLYRLSARSPPLAGRAGADPGRSRRRRPPFGRRLSRRHRLARPQADRRLVCGDEVAAELPPSARRADGGDHAAAPITTSPISDGPWQSPAKRP